MSAWLVSLLFTVGASAWIYTKLQRYSGNNTKQSAVATAFMGLFIFIMMLSILTLIF